MARIDPWGSGQITDYEDVFKEFGLKPFPEKWSSSLNHYLFERNIVVAHRDFDLVFQKIKTKKPFVNMTGIASSGQLHLGHYIGSLVNRLKLQETCRQFVMIADAQALTHNADNPGKIRDNILQVALDYLAVGIDPKKTTIFVQTQVPEIQELAFYFMNLVTMARLQRNPTVKDEMKDKGYNTNAPVGFIVHPISQAADILSVKAEIVPVGEDQLPMIEQTNEIVKKFNSLYGSVFKPVKAELSKVTRLPGADGKSKMSKSLGNAIYLSASRKEIEKVVMSMYTDPKHLKVSDPGKIEGNVVFTYLKAFATDQQEVKSLEVQYKKGGLGDVMLKKKLVDELDNLLKPIRDKRQQLEKNPQQVMKIVKDGTAVTRKVVAQTMIEVKRAMKLNYF